MASSDNPSSSMVNVSGHLLSSTATFSGHPLSSTASAGGQQPLPMVSVGELMPLIASIGGQASFLVQSIGGSSQASTEIASHGSASVLSLEGGGSITPDHTSEPDVTPAIPSTNALGPLFFLRHCYDLLND